MSAAAKEAISNGLKYGKAAACMPTTAIEDQSANKPTLGHAEVLSGEEKKLLRDMLHGKDVHADCKAEIARLQRELSEARLDQRATLMAAKDYHQKYVALAERMEAELDARIQHFKTQCSNQ